MLINCLMCRQGLLQSFFVEVRIPFRTGVTPDIGEQFDIKREKQVNKFARGSGGMPESINNFIMR